MRCYPISNKSSWNSKKNHLSWKWAKNIKIPISVRNVIGNLFSQNKSLAEYKHENRTPFAAIYTSLGCTFQCDFCMINILNRNDNEEVGVASNYAGMRFWSPEWVMKQFSTLDEMGVTTIRISDEMFLLNKRYFVPLCEMLRDTGLGKKLLPSLQRLKYRAMAGPVNYR